MRFRKKKGRTCDTARYVLEKASKTRKNCIILQTVTMKGAKGTISLAQAKDMIPGPNCMLKSL